MRSSSEPPASAAQPPTDTVETLATLVTMIDTARRLAVTVATDGLLMRLHRAFAQMPEEDRETILQVLEREVQSRLMTRGTSDLGTGYETRPNPNARLYLRILNAPGTPSVMDHEELVVANLRGLRALRHRLGPSHAAWHDALTEAVQLLDPSERAAARRVMQETVAALEAADSAGAEPST